MPRFEPHPQRRTAVVTGASSGIGAATAIALATAGHPVALGARRAGQCEELAATIRAGGGEAIGLPLDDVEDDSVQDFAEAVAGELGPVEILVSALATWSGRARARAGLGRVRPAGPGQPRRGAPAGGGHGAGHGRPPARRHRVHFLRRRARAAAADGRLRGGQERDRRNGPGHADGTGGHRGPGLRRPPRPDDDRHGHGLETRGRSRRCSTTGCSGAWPGTRTSCGPPTWPPR